MACFIVPAAEALVVTTVCRVLEKKEKKTENTSPATGYTRSTFLKRRRWLTNLLWGGSFLLAFEHLWHGEIVPWFPFLSAALTPEDTAAMLKEMASAGVVMALLVTMVWVGMVLVATHLEKSTQTDAEAGERS